MRHPLCLNDITVFPPPCMNAERAADIYNPAFQRIMEYVVNSRIEGDVFEFGTFNGYTARTLAEMMYAYQHQGHLRLYDSWEGFPAMEGGDAECPEVVQHKTWKQGDCTPIIPNADVWIEKILSMVLPERVHCVKGFYNDTFIPEPKSLQASVIHIDCDLYESTVYVLRQMFDCNLVSEGAVIMFDDWNNNFGSNKYGERKAVKTMFPQYKDGIRWNIPTPHLDGYGLEPWFSYGSSGMAFIVQKS